MSINLFDKIEIITRFPYMESVVCGGIQVVLGMGELEWMYGIMEYERMGMC